MQIKLIWSYCPYVCTTIMEQGYQLTTLLQRTGFWLLLGNTILFRITYLKSDTM